MSGIEDANKGVGTCFDLTSVAMPDLSIAAGNDEVVTLNSDSSILSMTTVRGGF